MWGFITGRGIVVMLVAVLIATLTPVAAFAATPEASEVQSVAVVGAPVGAATGELSVPFGSGSSVRIVYEGPGSVGKAGDDLLQPMFSVGFGWFVYVYLNRNDWYWLAGLGAGGAMGALASLIGVAGVYGAIAWGMAAVIVGTYLYRWSAPRTGYCREFKFPYTSYVIVGVKDVRRSC